LLRRPFDLALAGIGKADIFHIAFFHFSGSQGLAPQIRISIVNGVSQLAPFIALGRQA
jgi:hypothetical protein